jgi:hypothetical protein
LIGLEPPSVIVRKAQPTSGVGVNHVSLVMSALFPF